MSCPTLSIPDHLSTELPYIVCTRLFSVFQVPDHLIVFLSCLKFFLPVKLPGWPRGRDVVPDVAGQVPQDSESLEGLYLLNLSQINMSQSITPLNDTKSLLYAVSVSFFKMIRCGSFLGSNSYLNFFLFITNITSYFKCPNLIQIFLWNIKYFLWIWTSYWMCSFIEFLEWIS